MKRLNDSHRILTLRLYTLNLVHRPYTRSKKFCWFFYQTAKKSEKILEYFLKIVFYAPP